MIKAYIKNGFNILKRDKVSLVLLIIIAIVSVIISILSLPSVISIYLGNSDLLSYISEETFDRLFWVVTTGYRGLIPASIAIAILSEAQSIPKDAMAVYGKKVNTKGINIFFYIKLAIILVLLANFFYIEKYGVYTTPILLKVLQLLGPLTMAYLIFNDYVVAALYTLELDKSENRYKKVLKVFLTRIIFITLIKFFVIKFVPLVNAIGILSLLSVYLVPVICFEDNK